MKTYKVTQVALLELWERKQPLLEVDIDGIIYYATSNTYGEIVMGPQKNCCLKQPLQVFCSDNKDCLVIDN